MAKKRASQTAPNAAARSPLVLSGAVVVVVVGVLLVVLSQGQSSAAAPVDAASASAPARVERIQPQGYLNQFSQQPHLLLDVRTPQEFASGHIPGAINISLQTLESRLSELPTDQPIVVYCRSGNRSATAGQMLLRRGFTQLYDLGGIITWQAQGLPVQ
jgi:rhodanese-related sulfurtransferase